jgi:hypothetical protein
VSAQKTSLRRAINSGLYAPLFQACAADRPRSQSNLRHYNAVRSPAASAKIAGATP